MQFPTFKIESQKLSSGFDFVVGCDEVGVGPVAGPVCAAACIIDPKTIGSERTKDKWYYRVRDSKTTTEKERELLVGEIKSHCLAFGIGQASAEEVDSINIHNAKLLATKRAVMDMLANFEKTDAANKSNNKNNSKQGTKIFLLMDGQFIIKDLLDGVEIAEFDITQQAIIDGDALILSISAASIIAKVHRDNILKQLDTEFPEYGFAKHKGYNTKVHQQAILKHGLTVHHRKSFLKSIVAQQA